jgi:hypothetical protein
VVIAGVISARLGTLMVQKLLKLVGNAVQTAARTAVMAAARTAAQTPSASLAMIIYAETAHFAKAAATSAVKTASIIYANPSVLNAVTEYAKAVVMVAVKMVVKAVLIVVVNHAIPAAVRWNVQIVVKRVVLESFVRLRRVPFVSVVGSVVKDLGNALGSAVVQDWGIALGIVLVTV